MRTDFPRVTPESVGVPSADIEWLLDRLEESCEPHGLMLMRHGKVFAEGWWAPYAPGLRHGLQSHSKTYAATAVGIAYTEGLLKLTDRIIDIFPEQAPANPSPNLQKLTVHHVLSMSNGMDAMPDPSDDWIRAFLAMPVNHEPGTAFMYNSMGSTLLAAIVKKATGMWMNDYLKPRLYDKIGIDADNLRWMRMTDGTEIGGGGLFATTEDNLRLMKLYANGGVWEGERILAEDFVRLAISKQIDNQSERAVNPMAEDNFVGYGYQIWMCRPKGVYRADGAMGQFTIVVPDRDLMIAITETALGMTGGYGPQNTLNILWEFLDRLPEPSVESLPEDSAASGHLAYRMSALSLPAPRFTAASPLQAKLEGRSFAVTEGDFRICDLGIAHRMGGVSAPAGVDTLRFRFETGRCWLDCVSGGKNLALEIGTDGTRRETVIPEELPSIALSDGHWETENTFEVTIRFVESCFHKKLRFRFEGGTLTIEHAGGLAGFGWLTQTPQPVIAKEVR